MNKTSDQFVYALSPLRRHVPCNLVQASAPKWQYLGVLLFPQNCSRSIVHFIVFIGHVRTFSIKVATCNVTLWYQIWHGVTVQASWDDMVTRYGAV